MSTRLQCIFFDATDTLLRVRGSVGEIYAELARRYGFAGSSEEIDASFRREIGEVPQRCAPGLPAAEIAALERGWWHEVARRTFETLGPFPRFDLFFAEVFELFRSPSVWELLPGARETVRALHEQGRRLAVISDMDSRLFDVLAAFDLEHAFAAIFLSFRIGYSKPDPRFFGQAVQQMGCPPEACLHVGDSVHKDLEGALSAGLHAALLDGTEDLELPPGAHRIRDLRELPGLVQQIER